MWSGAGTDVLVVGAGPTGLTLANELTRWGIAARVVEKAPLVSQHTKALGVQARTLEMVERLGLASAMVERGLPVTAFTIVSEGKPIARLDLGAIDSPYPYLLMLPQNEVEGLLHERLVASGVDVDHNVELVGLHDHGDHVDVGLRAGHGSIERIAARWVVGCDGAHSTVRHLLGVPFAGSAFEQRFAVADVELEWTLPGDEVFAFLDRGRFMAFFPMTRGRHRIAIAYPAAEERPGEVNPAELRDAFAAIGPPGRIREVNWASRFRINQRNVGHQRLGRVFLAGDAAHVHSLVGAQGMNTGIQDAMNLGWKLGMHLVGAAPQDILDSYAPEREQVAHRLVKGTRRFTRMTLLGSPIATAARRTIAPLVLSRSGVRDRIERAISQIDVSYPHSPLHGGAAHGRPGPGDRAPDGLVLDREGAEIRLFDLLREPRYTLLEFTERPAPPAVVRLGRQGRFLAHYRLVDRAGDARGMAGNELVDPGGRVRSRYGLPESGFVLVRPDGYVAARGDRDGSGVRSFLDRWLLDARDVDRSSDRTGLNR
jgi:2-polyprenyl-6-methoxyphenol hydroxylase-like FAD-dependent oxidoreductase